MRTRRSAFTLVEMLVVITIIGMLMALLVPGIQAARESARQTRCASHQRNAATAILTYANSKQRLPPTLSLYSLTPDAWIVGGGSFDPDLVWGWVPPLLTELGEPAIYDQMTTALEAVYAGGSKAAYASIFDNLYVENLSCPSDTTRETLDQPWISYYVNGGRHNVAAPPFGYGAGGNGGPPDWKQNGAMMVRIQRKSGANNKDFLESQFNTLDEIARGDGVSMTILLSENVNHRNFGEVLPNTWSNTYRSGGGVSDLRPPQEHDSAILWHDGEAAYLHNGMAVRINEHKDHALDAAHARPSSYHPGVVVVTFCDGSTRTISETIHYEVYGRLMSSKGREARVPGDFTTGPAWQADAVTEADLQP